jgi:Mrp family chromosome partitioning ATPase
MVTHMPSAQLRPIFRATGVSDKDGVDKSTVAVNLATAFAIAGQRVVLFYFGIHGPNLPKFLYIERSRIEVGQNAMPLLETNAKFW